MFGRKRATHPHKVGNENGRNPVERVRPINGKLGELPANVSNEEWAVLQRLSRKLAFEAEQHREERRIREQAERQLLRAVAR